MSQKDILRLALAQDTVHRPASMHLIAACLELSYREGHQR
jgi:hypothetical protein